MYSNPYAPTRWNPTNIEVHEAAAPTAAAPPPAPRDSSNTTRMVVGGLLVAGGVGGLIWWYAKRQKAQAAAAATPQIQTQGAQALTLAPGLLSAGPGLVTQESQVLQYTPADQLAAQEVAQPIVSPGSEVPPPPATPLVITPTTPVVDTAPVVPPTSTPVVDTTPVVPPASTTPPPPPPPPTRQVGPTAAQIRGVLGGFIAPTTTPSAPLAPNPLTPRTLGGSRVIGSSGIAMRFGR